MTTLESELNRINELLFSQARETNMSHQEREVRLGEALEAQIAAISQLVRQIIGGDAGIHNLDAWLMITRSQDQRAREQGLDI